MKGNRLIYIALVLALSFLLAPVVFAYENFCLEFKAGDDTKVVAEHNDSLNITGELTMEAWIYPTEILGQAIIVNKENTWEIELQNLILKAAINSARWAWEGGGKVELNQWNHVAVSFDTKEHHTFINGEYQVSTSIPGNIKPSTENFHVGWRPCCGNEPFSGLIDEVRISDVVRYPKGKDFPVPTREFKPDKNTVVLYHFNAGNGASAKDESEYKNDGEVTNAKWMKSDAPIGPAAIDIRNTLSTTWSRIKTY